MTQTRAFSVPTSCKKSKNLKVALFQVISENLNFWAKLDFLTPVPQPNEFLVK